MIKNFILKLYEPISPKPLAVFRICFGLNLLFEFFHFFYRRELVLNQFPLTNEISNFTYAWLFLWGFSILCFIVGLCQPIASFGLYLGVVYFFKPDLMYSYHADMIYVEVAFLCLFLPLSRAYSFDTYFLRKIRGVKTEDIPIPRMYQHCLILYAMGFMYFDSTFYKLESSFWRDGLGLWLPAGFPSFTTISFNWLLNQKLIILVCGYASLAFEATFIFVYWFRFLRPMLFLIGLILHIGIAIILPIPLFGLVMCIIYLLFFPDPILNRVFGFSGARGFFPSLKIAPHDKIRSSMIAAIVAILFLFQLSITFNQPLLSENQYEFLKSKLGVTGHTVFGHRQFKMMNQVRALIYIDDSGNEKWVSYSDESGHVGLEGYSRFWSYWWITSLPDKNDWRERCARSAEAWFKRNKIDPRNGSVIVREKIFKTDQVWEKDRHKLNSEMPWKDVLKIYWNGKLERNFKEIS